MARKKKQSPWVTYGNTILQVGGLAIIVIVVALFILMTADTTFNMGEQYVSSLQNGEYSLIFNVLLITSAILIATTMPSLLAMLRKEAKNNHIAITFLNWASVLGVITIILIFPVAIFQWDSDTILGMGVTEGMAHAFFALRMFSSAIIFLFLLALTKFFIIANKHKRKHLKQMQVYGFVVISIGTILTFMAEVFKEYVVFIFGIMTVMFVGYYIYIFFSINKNYQLDLKKISIESRLLLVVLLMDLMIIVYGDATDFWGVFTGKINTGEASLDPTNVPFSNIETLLIFNILFVLAYIYIKQVLKNRK